MKKPKLAASLPANLMSKVDAVTTEEKAVLAGFGLRRQNLELQAQLLQGEAQGYVDSLAVKYRSEPGEHVDFNADTGKITRKAAKAG